MLIIGVVWRRTKQRHITRLSNDMHANGHHNVHIKIKTLPEFSQFVPSTPAVAIVCALKELIYLGLYSEGYGCL
jgi:hypothetical protein